MKKSILLLFILGLTTLSCSKKEEPVTSGAADYSETYEELIDNKNPDSTATDTIQATSGQPGNVKAKEGL